MFSKLSWLGGWGVKLDLAPARCPFTGVSVAWSAKGVARDSITSPKDPPLSGAFW